VQTSQSDSPVQLGYSLEFDSEHETKKKMPIPIIIAFIMSIYIILYFLPYLGQL